MRKFLKNNVLISTIIGGIMFAIINTILDVMHLKFIYVIYMISIIMFIVGFIAGIYQILLNLKKFKTIFIVTFTIILITILPIVYIIFAIRYQPTHIVEINGEKMIAQVDKAFMVRVNYYDYINALIINKTPRMIKDYGDGSYDPIKDNREDYLSEIYYYDKKGNRVSDFYGTPYMDLSYVKDYDSKEASPEEAVKFLETLLEKYKNNLFKMDLYREDGFLIYFSENSENIADNDELKRMEYVINKYIEEIKLVKNLQLVSKYNISITDYGMIIIYPDDNESSRIMNLFAMDITEDFINKPRELKGTVYYKELDAIHFRTEGNKYYIIKNDERIKFIDSRTNENYNFKDIHDGNYVNTTIDGTIYINE